MAILPWDVTINGVALSTYGLTSWDTYDGVGLVTDGLLWSCPNIWWGPWNSPGTTSISSTWTLAAGNTIATTWTLAAGNTISTTWVDFSTYNIEDC